MGLKKAKTTKAKASAKIDVYKYYEATVQCVESDIEFINNEFKRLRKKRPHILREDFGGTGKLACEWAKQGPRYQSFAIDLDMAPIQYGLDNHYSKLKVSEQKRVNYINKNVLNAKKHQADVIVAFNFSYFVFKKRKELLNYFKSVRQGLLDGGVFFIDLFGGYEAQQILEEETEYDGYSYFWDCDKFNPITNECLFKIHFKPDGQKKIVDAFTYDWRLWSLAELREILDEAGFSKTVAYWEEDDEDEDSDEGNGVFYPTEEAENCQSWVTYIAALK